MSKNNDNSNKNSESQNFKEAKISIEKKSIEKTLDHKSSEYVDIVLSRKGAKVVNSETLTKEAQKRICHA